MKSGSSILKPKLNGLVVGGKKLGEKPAKLLWKLSGSLVKAQALHSLLGGSFQVLWLKFISSSKLSKIIYRAFSDEGCYRRN